MKQIDSVKVDPNSPPNAMPTSKIVYSLKKLLSLSDYIENKMELKDSLENFKDTLVPPILKEDKGII